MNLDEMCAVGDGKFTRVGRKGDNKELIEGLIGSGKWRRLKGGVTMDSGCSIDTMPVGHAPTIKMGPIPASRASRRINAANGTKIKEHGVKQLKFRTREGKRQAWDMIVTDVKKALKSVATTCDGVDTGECFVLFTRHGGTIINVDKMKGSFSVDEVSCAVLASSPSSTGPGTPTEWRHGYTSVMRRRWPRLKFPPGRSQLHRPRIHKPAGYN